MIAIIDYGAGNVRSVETALNRIGVESVLTDDINQLTIADKVIFPGVGHAAFAMEQLKNKKLMEVIKNLKQPVLGICLGQQLLCDFTEEGQTKGLGIFDVEVKAFPKTEILPHMGWNQIRDFKGELFSGMEEESDVYFVHSFYCELSVNTIASAEYILPFSAALQKDNFYATQFHPEKSSSIGQIILQNFIAL